MHQKGIVIWFTGLSGSGKTTLANLLKERLSTEGYKTCHVDGDLLRTGLCSDLGFSDSDRSENIRRAAELCKVLYDCGIVVIASLISPFETDRRKARNLFPKGSFLEVYLDADLETCEQRDVKGLYKKARAGQIESFTGIDSPYELPENPDLILSTGINSKEECAAFLHDFILPRIKS
ncbi:MAG: adenylyl-sulfate kinase [Bacteroidetes bacterium]|nr:MAG: adenylyl-sulfate kinase [Bacteroidota bacterium]REK04896.1 MAG: adenylyl-sulfate kinase [Bacteroidota bacterium]REK36368.1 MAG: adenylyl-sulfate kinase [Bacteroidota bacterium]REK50966.1 MAG: adenylyl-sulfate kinase [Bacteroidota bacterium]